MLTQEQRDRLAGLLYQAGLLSDRTMVFDLGMIGMPLFVSAEQAKAFKRWEIEHARRACPLCIRDVLQRWNPWKPSLCVEHRVRYDLIPVQRRDAYGVAMKPMGWLVVRKA